MEHFVILVSLYMFSLIGGTVSTLISVIVINLSRSEQKYSMPHLLAKFLTSKYVKQTFFLYKFEVRLTV